MIDIAIRALESAVQSARNYNKRAEERGQQDVQRVQNYLMAAQAAIQGLEREYDQILVQAKYCEVDQPEQVKALKERIETYLTVDQLRDELLKAQAGLKRYREELQRHAERFVQLPWRKTNRLDAVAQFADLLAQLEQYVLKLEQEGLQYRMGGSGIAVRSLMDILEALDTEAELLDPEEAPVDLTKLVHKIQGDRSKDALINFTVDIQRNIDELMIQFR